MYSIVSSDRHFSNDAWATGYGGHLFYNNATESCSRGTQTTVSENIVDEPSSLRACLGQRYRVFDRIDPAVDRNEVLRYLGYPAGKAPDDRLRGIIHHWIEEAGRIATPRAVYVILPVAEIDKRSLDLRTDKGVVPFKGAIGEFLGPSRMVAAFIATAGPEVERLANQLQRHHEDLAAVVVNAVGAERAEAAEAAVIQRLREQGQPDDFAPTLPYSPGYCGMALVEQRKLFGLFEGKTVGVTLTEDCLMRPLKSISGLIGLAPTNEIQAHGSPCDRCELYSCAMRR